MWYFHRRRKEKWRQQERLHWGHPVNQKRDGVGLFHTLSVELKDDENKILNYFRMSASLFDELSERLLSDARTVDVECRHVCKLRLHLIFYYLMRHEPYGRRRTDVAVCERAHSEF
jgi:hypothetical protein